MTRCWTPDLLTIQSLGATSVHVQISCGLGTSACKEQKQTWKKKNMVDSTNQMIKWCYNGDVMGHIWGGP